MNASMETIAQQSVIKINSCVIYLVVTNVKIVRLNLDHSS